MVFAVPHHPRACVYIYLFNSFDGVLVQIAMLSDVARERAEQKALKKKKRAAAYSWSSTKWDKEWMTQPRVNEYTITMDIKLKNEPPREGLALYQTSLVFTEENPTSGRKVHFFLNYCFDKKN